jgi:hypothetical protein
VATYWGIALIVKIIFVYVSNFMIPTNNVLNPDKTKNNENFSLIEAIVFFAAQFLCDVMCFVLIIDSNFIKVFTFDKIRQYEDK